jgi:hypothetical protein
MIGVLWNIRGLNKLDRTKCVADLIKHQKLDFIGIQETKKDKFEDGFLKILSGNMSWNYIPANRIAGAILVGFNNHKIEILSWLVYNFCAISIVKNYEDEFIWGLIVVYGSPYEESKTEFIEELDKVMGDWKGPTLIGEDFNLVRSQKEKSNGIVNFGHVTAFNEWIHRWGLMEISDPSRSFTWTNDQKKLIRAKLDRILVFVEWEK